VIEYAIGFAHLALGLSLLLCLWRLLRGPDLPDRILALDTLYVNGVALIVLFGIRAPGAASFEAALLIALVGFVSTVALARYVLRGDVMD
jgi:multicomponent K+:H+ antiporter subunit F